MLKIENDGQRIVATNYWDSEPAKAGYAYLTWNAGAARLLLPDALIPALPDMRTAEYVIVSRGRWEAQGRDDALELMWEDHSDSPYALWIVAEQTDRLIVDKDDGRDIVVTVWTRSGEQLRLPGRYRRVATLPCLRPWSARG